MTNKYHEFKLIRDEKMYRELETIYKKANCRGKPTKLFFPELGKGLQSCKPGTPLHEAFTLCNDCDVKQECLAFGVKHDCVGVWGGRYISFVGVSNIQIKQGEIE